MTWCWFAHWNSRWVMRGVRGKTAGWGKFPSFEGQDPCNRACFSHVFHGAILCLRHMFLQDNQVYRWNSFPTRFAHDFQHILLSWLSSSQALAGGQCQNQVSIFRRGETEPLQACHCSSQWNKKWANSLGVPGISKTSDIKEWSFQCRSMVKPPDSWQVVWGVPKRIGRILYWTQNWSREACGFHDAGGMIMAHKHQHIQQIAGGLPSTWTWHTFLPCLAGGFCVAGWRKGSLGLEKSS